ncbi:MAG: hypothetical protein LBK94_06415 [Prevotellaceae bacterium]|jgi:hypothetical protein|nr:hypothetical protein [Prevotellaceae bacterium]
MRTKFFLALFVAGSMIFTGCSDDDPVNPPVVDKNYNVKEFFSNSREKLVQVIELNTSNLPTTITLDGGTKITIDEGTFAITGSFTVEVIECLKPSSIVYSGTNTNYIDGRLFASDGFLFIDVKQNGTSVDKNLLKNMDVEIPVNSDRTLTMLWEGVDIAGVDENQFAWNELAEDAILDDQFAGGRMEVGANDAGFFFFRLGKLGWFNCDIYWEEPAPKTTLTVTLTGGPIELASYQGATGYTCVFFHGYGDLVVAQLYTPAGTNKVKSYDDSMPVGKTGTLFAFTVKEGEFYLAKQENVTIVADMEVDLDLVKTTEEAIQAAIDALDD